MAKPHVRILAKANVFAHQLSKIIAHGRQFKKKNLLNVWCFYFQIKQSQEKIMKELMPNLLINRISTRFD